MNKHIKNIFFAVCAGAIILAIPMLLAHHTPLQVDLVKLDAQEIAAQKEAAAEAEKQAARQARAARVYACSTDEDCIIVDKDPCGCSAGPKGVVAINVNHIVDFNAMNNKNAVTSACAETVSQEKECSPSARPVCKARRCKIEY